jgi:tRNA (guanine37-N1)-methyltransferase
LIFYILSLFPEMFAGYLEGSILGKSIEADQIEVKLINIRDFAFDKHKSCDSAPYGGGPGMLLKPEPLSRAIESVGEKVKRTVYLTPSGRLFNQQYAVELSKLESILLICGHYEGIDQRIIDIYVNDEISIGDYVIFSGEVAAMVVLDAVTRLVEHIVKPESLKEESFTRGLLEYPQYTRPQCFKDREVPEVLVSGHHANIRAWRIRKSLEKTFKYRPDLLNSVKLTQEQMEILEEIRQEEMRDGSDKGS